MNLPDLTDHSSREDLAGKQLVSDGMHLLACGVSSACTTLEHNNCGCSEPCSVHRSCVHHGHGPLAGCHRRTAMAGAPLTEPACLPADRYHCCCCAVLQHAMPPSESRSQVQCTSPVPLCVFSRPTVLHTCRWLKLSSTVSCRCMPPVTMADQVHPSTPKNRPDMGEKKRMHYK